VLKHPQVCKEVHAAYIDAGAQVIMANSYCTNRLVLDVAGFGEHTVSINQEAVALVAAARREAGQEESICVAGCIAAQPPNLGGSYTEGWPSPEKLLAVMEEQASLLKDSGSDVIFAELIFDLEHGLPVIRAALNTGMPVFVSFVASFMTTAEWNAQKWSSDADVADAPVTLALGRDLVTDAVQAVMALPNADKCLAGFCVHHTEVQSSLRVLQAVRKHWSGPLGCYPDHGVGKQEEGKALEWQFHELTKETLVKAAESWTREANVQLLGTCCGLGPDHIRMLAEYCRAHNGSRAQQASK